MDVHRHHILNLSETESLLALLGSHNLPHLRKWCFHSSSWLGPKCWNYPCLSFSPFHALYPIHRKVSQLYHQNISKMQPLLSSSTTPIPRTGCHHLPSPDWSPYCCPCPQKLSIHTAWIISYHSSARISPVLSFLTQIQGAVRSGPAVSLTFSPSSLTTYSVPSALPFLTYMEPSKFIPTAGSLHSLFPHPGCFAPNSSVAFSLTSLMSFLLKCYLIGVAISDWLI